MADTRGVFGLSRAYQRIARGSWVDPRTAFAANFATTPNAGYFAGGTTPSEISSIDKCNFTDDTTALLPSADLTGVRSTHGSVSSNKAGYYIGGRTPLISSCDKLLYSIETISKTPGLNLTSVIQDARGFGNDTHGYSTGGYNGSSYVSVVDKIIFGTDTSFRFPSANLITQRNIHGALATQDAGYVTNGYDGSGYVNSAEKTVFATDTTTAIPSTFPGSRGGVTGASTDTIGYISGGVEPGPIFYSTVNKFTFSTETPGAAPTLPSANSLPASLQYNGGAATSSLAYFAGGKGSGAAINTMCTINAADDTKTNVPGANLTATRYNYSAVTPKGQSRTIPSYFDDFSQHNPSQKHGPVHGYCQNGYRSSPGGHDTGVTRIQFSNDSASRIPSADITLSTPAANGKTPFSNNQFGYFVGGIGPLSDIIKLNYATETSANIPAKMAQPQSVGSGAASDKTGYVLGGSKPGAYTNNCISVDLATDTSELLTNNLSIAAGFKAGVSDSTAAYACGGVTPGPTIYSTVDKFTFSTESSVRVPGANLSVPRTQPGSLGDQTAGYIVAGDGPGPNYSSTDKLTYASETTQRQTTADRTQTNIAYFTGTGNQTTGYCFGGNIAPSTTGFSSIDKMSFASDTFYRNTSDMCFPYFSNSAASGREQNRTIFRPQETPTLNQSLSTSGIPNFGYMAGGSGPGSTSPLSSIGKYNFETDTRLPFTGQLSIARYIGASGSSSTAGYIAMGLSYVAPTYYRHSRVDKLTFATENVAPVPGANTPVSLQNSCGASSSLAAYFSGGAPGPVATTQKLTFSDETTATVPGAALSGARSSPRAGASSSAMYMCGGVVPGSVPLSTVDKLIFSTDTTSVTPSAALNGTRYVGAMAGNATQGYYGGGLRYTGSYVGLSDINKINYSTDTTQLIGASLSRSSWNIGATGNATKAYFAGGVPGSVSTVDKLDYVTETTTFAEPLSGTRYGVIGVSGRVNAGAYTSNVL